MKDILVTEGAFEEGVSGSGRKNPWQPEGERVPRPEKRDSKENEEQPSESRFRLGPYGRRWPARAA
jgi:hypothetical protein